MILCPTRLVAGDGELGLVAIGKAPVGVFAFGVAPVGVFAAGPLATGIFADSIGGGIRGVVGGVVGVGVATCRRSFVCGAGLAIGGKSMVVGAAVSVDALKSNGDLVLGTRCARQR